MFYKGSKITMDNYEEIFSACTPDIKDEIRSAILDDTDIIRYISGCGRDNYKLGQIRMAIREGIPRQYLLAAMDGGTIHYIRICVQRKVDLSALDDYIKNGKLLIDAESLNYIVVIMSKGADISGINFKNFKKDLIPIVCNGVLHGYPMDVFENVPWLTSDYISTLTRGMALDIDVSLFLGEMWDTDKLIMMFSNSRAIDINEFLQYVNAKYEYAQLKNLIDAKKKGLDIKIIAVQDEDGYPLYNEFQMEVLIEAMEKGINSGELFNPNLSDREMSIKLEELLKNS